MVLAVAIATGETVYHLLLCFNAYFDGYFVGVAFLLLLPLYIACALLIIFVSDKTSRGRAWLKWACLLVVLSILGLIIWTCVYINNLYEDKYVYEGLGDRDDGGNYTFESKRSYLTKAVLFSICVIILFVYFFFVCMAWEGLAEEDEQKKKGQKKK